MIRKQIKNYNSGHILCSGIFWDAYLRFIKLLRTPGCQCLLSVRTFRLEFKCLSLLPFHCNNMHIHVSVHNKHCWCQLLLTDFIWKYSTYS